MTATRRLVLSILALPLYALGFLAALVAIVLVWCWASLGVGFDDARRLMRSPQPGDTDGTG